MVYTKTYKFAILYRQKKYADFSTKHQIVLKNKLRFCEFFKEKSSEKTTKNGIFSRVKNAVSISYFFKIAM